MPTLEKLEKRRRSKAMDKAAPAIRFSDLWCRVDNELIARQKTDFTLTELHELVGFLTKP